MSASEGLEYNKARGNFNFRWVAMKRLSATAGLLVLVGLMVLGGGFARTEDPQKPVEPPKLADPQKPADPKKPAADAQDRGDNSLRAPAKGDNSLRARAKDNNSRSAPAKDDNSPQAPGKDDWAGKTDKFEMRDKPWNQVLEQLADWTGIPVILIKDNKPTGTFTYIAPKSGPKEYTIPQVIDILNQSLEGQNYLLIRRSASFTLVRSDQKIDPALVPRIGIDDLKQHGDTEYASVVLPLKALMAEDEVKEVDKMMGPFGTAVAMTEANQLVLRDTVGNLKRVVKTLQDYESMEKGQAVTLTYKCRYIKAREAEKILKELLGDPEKLYR